MARGGPGTGLSGALRRNATLLALLGCALGLGAYLKLSGGPGDRPEPGETEPLLPAGSLEPARADGGAPRPLLFVLQARGTGGQVTTLSLRRHEVGGRGRYWLDGPSTHERADDEAGEALYSALRDGRMARRLPGALTAAARYGLDDGGYRGRLLLGPPGGGVAAGASAAGSAGAGTAGAGRVLRLGEEAPGDLVYAAWEGERDVLLVPQQLLQLVRRERDAYRRHALLPDDLAADPARLDLGPVGLERRPSSWIVHEGNQRARARTEDVRAILELLRSGRPVRMLEGGGLPYRGDFPELAAPVLWRPGAVRSAPFALRIDGVEQLFYGLPCPEPVGAPAGADGGAPAASDSAVYAVRSDGARLCLRAEDGARLQPTFAALRERRLLPFPPRSVSRVRIGASRLEGGGGRYTLDGRPADAGAVLAYLDALGAAEGTAPSPQRQNPSCQRSPQERTDAAESALVLETEAGDSVSLRARPLAGAGACVQRDEEEPLAVPAAALELLRPDPLRFLPRTLLAVPPATVTAVTLARRGAAAKHGSARGSEHGEVIESAERRGGAWTLVGPVTAPADGVHLGRVLALLSDLRVERWLEPAPGPGSDLGALRVSLRAGTAEQGLRLGTMKGTGCAAQAAGGPVGLLPREVCEALARPLSARELLLLDEARLREVRWSGPGGRHALSRAERGYLLDGRPVDAGPILEALRRLDRGEPAGYGAATAPPGAPILTIEVRHAPLSLPAAPDSSVAPPQQRLLVHRTTRGLLARLDGRDVTYALPTDEAALRALR